MKFPNPCCRCGFCCLSETCKIGQIRFGISSKEMCPALDWKEEGAYCTLVEEISSTDLGIGEGCCIKARAYKDGVEYSFAFLPPHIKRIASRQKLFQIINERRGNKMIIDPAIDDKELSVEEATKRVLKNILNKDYLEDDIENCFPLVTQEEKKIIRKRILEKFKMIL